jgi:myosin heavy subunit
MSIEKLAKKVLEKGKVDDLILLEDVSEESIVENIKNRFSSDLIYTFIG